VLALVGATVPVIAGARWFVKHVQTRRREDLERRILEVLEITPPSQVWTPAAIRRAITTIKQGRRAYLDASGNLAERIEITFRSPSAPPLRGFRKVGAELAATRAYAWFRARRQHRQGQAVLERLRHMRERGLVEQEFTGHWRLKHQRPPGY
jgi:hypothetical protein